MSCISTIYVFKNLKTPEEIPYNNICDHLDTDSLELYDKCFEENFGNNAFFYTHNSITHQELINYAEELYNEFKKLTNGSSCHLSGTVITLDTDFVQKYKERQIKKLKALAEQTTTENYDYQKYKIEDLLNAKDVHVLPANGDDGNFIQPVDRWLLDYVEPDKETYILVINGVVVKG